MGSVGVFERDGLDVHDIGFSFLPEYEGKGYGFEAASALLEVAFSEFGLQKISAITSNANISSQKLIEKLGLKYLKHIRLPNDEEELRYYEIDNKLKKETH
ncbi:MAG: GNAT family N-acetyltransferase [Kaistella sp.]